MNVVDTCAAQTLFFLRSHGSLSPRPRLFGQNATMKPVGISGCDWWRGLAAPRRRRRHTTDPLQGAQGGAPGAPAMHTGHLGGADDVPDYAARPGDSGAGAAGDSVRAAVRELARDVDQRLRDVSRLPAQVARYPVRSASVRVELWPAQRVSWWCGPPLASFARCSGLRPLPVKLTSPLLLRAVRPLGVPPRPMPPPHSGIRWRGWSNGEERCVYHRRAGAAPLEPRSHSAARTRIGRRCGCARPASLSGR